MGDNHRYLIGLCRAAGGAIIFGLPLLMTMEMWWLGFTIDRTKLLLLILLLMLVLAALSFHAGFEPTFDWRDDVLDAFVAYGVGFGASVLMLLLLGLITMDTAVSDAIGKITVQAVPASFGAMLGRTLLGGERVDDDHRRADTYGGELFLMAAGALFLSFSIAPTEEITHISTTLSTWGITLLAIVSLVQMHVFVYAVEFHGQHSRPDHATVAGEFVRLTVVGYAMVLVISAYVLWTFGRTDGLAWLESVRATVVLGFPASIGAAAARLIL
jgi:putative integral membrane protein (TIGR02587 family)